MLCPRQVCQVRCSCECHERCTAVLIGAMMVFVRLHAARWYDEENFFTELEIVKVIMEEGKEDGSQGFFIGGDLKIELGSGEGEFQGLDSLDWYDDQISLPVKNVGWRY